ncbi:MAG: hypothetical protein ABR585_07895 [Gemmatimonadaceae bacterium]
MADYEIPDDLIKLQRAFNAAHAHLLEVSAEMPSGRELSDEQRAVLAEARAEELRLIGELYDEERRAGMDNERLYRKQLQAAAKSEA